MAIAATYRGVSFLVPETDEEDWGDEVTAQLVALLSGGNVTEKETAAGNVIDQATVGADLSVVAAATVPWTHNVHGVQSTGGAVTVSAATGIAAGEFDRQKLILVGLSNTNTIQIDSAGNVDPNGAWVSSLGYHIVFRWDDTNSLWREESRSH